MIRVALLLAAVAAASPAFAAEKRFDVSGFDKVAVGGSDNVIIRQGNGFSVVATGDQDDLDKLDIKVQRGTLGIGRKSSFWSMMADEVQIIVTMPALRGVSVGGSADVQADRGVGEVFDARLGGSGDLLIGRIDAKTVTAALSGSGNIKAAGQCSALNVRLAGSGDADLAGLACTTADIRLAGSGNVSARASGEAAVSLAGSGDVLITGGAKCTRRIAGSGEVTCK